MRISERERIWKKHVVVVQSFRVDRIHMILEWVELPCPMHRPLSWKRFIFHMTECLVTRVNQFSYIIKQKSLSILHTFSFYVFSKVDSHVKKCWCWPISLSFRKRSSFLSSRLDFFFFFFLSRCSFYSYLDGNNMELEHCLKLESRFLFYYSLFSTYSFDS